MRDSSGELEAELKHLIQQCTQRASSFSRRLKKRSKLRYDSADNSASQGGTDWEKGLGI